MKKKILISLLLLIMVATESCRKNILEAQDPNKITEEGFFNKVTEANQAVIGVYLASRSLHYKTYAWDGASDIMFSRISNRPYSNYFPGNSFGSSVARHWGNAYRVINRANYVLINVRRMIGNTTVAADLTELRRYEAEAMFFRALAYFRLIDLWGDVPYYENILEGNAEAYTLTRTSKTIIKDKILADLDKAINQVPITVSENGRLTRAAVYGYRGKVKLYWACWMKNEGNITEAQTYYTQAAADFAEVMKTTYGRTLYKNGAAGTADAPNYGEMFDGDPVHESDMYKSEVIFAFTNGGPTFGGADNQTDEFYGDTYIYDFGTRSTGQGGVNVAPEMRFVNRYQLIATGGYAPALIPLNGSTVADARTRVNSALNPNSYVGRDYRMKATIMWDGQTIGELDANGATTGRTLMYQFKTNSPNPPYLNADGSVTGYLYRKYIRQFSGYAREAGPQDSWMMRLPDVWLMYCEAVNEVSGPTAECYDLVDKIRARGALPPLNRAAFSTKATFFSAIEQERIIELAAEGSRFFDIRRWKMVEQIWPTPNGNTVFSTWNENLRDEFRNAIDRDYQRFYQFQIPTAEIQNNPNLKQNDPWL